MSSKIAVKKAFCQISNKVKSVCLHSENPWVLSGRYDGVMLICNYESQTMLKTFEINQHPIRSAIFIPKQNWVAVASDDHHLRLYNYNTMEKIEDIVAHSDFIRFIDANPVSGHLLTCSDDEIIHLWKYDAKGKLKKISSFQEHRGFVMQARWSPKDPNIFASCSIDGTIKLWNMNTKNSNLTLKDHTSGVNAIDFHRLNNWLVSGSDDLSVKVWDYQEKKCLFTLKEHTLPIYAVKFHPELPYIFSGSEDGQVILWNTNTFRSTQTFNYYMQKNWAIDVNAKKPGFIALAYEEGTLVLKLGGDEPRSSLHNGKLLSNKNHEIYTANLKAIPKKDLVDGAPVQCTDKEIGRSDIYPQMIKHSPNGLNFVVSDGEEFVIYKVTGFKNIHFGSGSKFVWSNSNGYAVHKLDEVKIFDSSFNQVASIKTSYQVDSLHGGSLLAIRSSDFVMFYDWETTTFIQKVEISCKDIFWNTQTSQLVISAPSQFYMLTYNCEKVKECLNSGEDLGDEGVEDAFEIDAEVNEAATAGVWLKNCFFFLNSQNKLNYTVKGKSMNYAYLEKVSQVLGYQPTQGVLFFIDGANKLISYEIPQAFINAIAKIEEEDFDGMQQELKKLENHKFHDKIAKYLEFEGNLEVAFSVVKNQEIKFDYAIRLEYIEEAHAIACQSQSKISLKQIGDLCLQKGQFEKAEEAFKLSEDFSSLFLMYSSLGDKEGIEWLGETTFDQKYFTLAFNCYFITRQVDKCVECLVETRNFPEAAFFSKTYCPSNISRIVQLWKDSLIKSHPLISQIIADPMEYEDDPQFEPLFISQKIEALLKEELKKDVPAEHYEAFHKQLQTDLVEMAQNSSMESVKDFIENSLGKFNEGAH